MSTYTGEGRPFSSSSGSRHIRASTEPVRSTSLSERKGTPRLSLRTAESVARKLECSLVPGFKSRVQKVSFFREHPPKPHRSNRAPDARASPAVNSITQHHHHALRSPGAFRSGAACYAIGALSCLALHRPGGQAGDDTALEDQDEYHERHGDDDCRCGLRAVVHRVLAGEVRDHYRYGLGRRGEHSRSNQGHYHLPERLYRRGPIHLGSLLEVL